MTDEEIESAALERRIECARLAMELFPDEQSKRDHAERIERLKARLLPLPKGTA